MARGNAVRNRSESVTVRTPRGPVEVARQETRELRRGSGWRWLWVARRAGSVDWHEATTPAEAIRRAILLPARTPPQWLRDAATDAEAQVLADVEVEADLTTDGEADLTSDGDASSEPPRSAAGSPASEQSDEDVERPD